MHLGEKLKAYKKQNNKDQAEMAGLLRLSVRKYAEIERTGVISKIEDREAVERLLGENKQNNADCQASYETKEDVLRMLDKSLDANNRHADANKKHADSINKLVSLITDKFSSGETGSGPLIGQGGGKGKPKDPSVLSFSGRKNPGNKQKGI